MLQWKFQNPSPHAHHGNVVQSVLELNEGVRRILEAVENCALHAVGTAGDTLCAEVLEVVLKVPECCALYSGGSEWCAMCAMSAGGHALHAVLYTVPYAVLVCGSCMLLCILEAVEGELRLMDVLE